jgi:hypothetical protein
MWTGNQAKRLRKYICPFKLINIVKSIHNCIKSWLYRFSWLPHLQQFLCKYIPILHPKKWTLGCVLWRGITTAMSIDWGLGSKGKSALVISLVNGQGESEILPKFGSSIEGKTYSCLSNLDWWWLQGCVDGYDGARAYVRLQLPSPAAPSRLYI